MLAAWTRRTGPYPSSMSAPTQAVIGAGRRSMIAMGRHVISGYGHATAQWRPDPEFLIIGAKRGGSTSFYYDLLRHSQIAALFPRPDHLPKAAATKGVHYFDQNYHRGERWYRSHLPSGFARGRQAHRVGLPVITGEASPYYLFHPAAAERAAAMLPKAKIIAVLRDPVHRTYSHWKERRREGMEDLAFQAALAAEDERIGEVEDTLRRDPAAYSYAHEQQSYARQSEYVTGLARWYEHYPREQILILSSEEYYGDPRGALDQAQDFLGLHRQPLGSGEVRNAAAGDAIDRVVAAELRNRFAPYNEQLCQLTGRTFPWA